MVLSDMKNYKKMISIGRPIDLGYFSNRYVVALSAITFVIYLLYGLFFVTQDISSIETYQIPLKAAIISFLAWAIGREFHPDDPLTAMVAQLITSLSFIFLFPNFIPSGMALFLILLCSRTTLLSSSKELTILDHLAVIGLAVFVGLSTQNWIYPMIATAAYSVNAYLRSDIRSVMGTVGMSFFTLFVWNRYGSIMYIHDISMLLKILAVVMLLLAILAVFFPKQIVTSRNDDNTEALKAERVIATQLVIIFATVLLANFASQEGLQTTVALFPVLSAFPLVRWFNQ